jgi:hypothetical protein
LGTPHLPPSNRDIDYQTGKAKIHKLINTSYLSHFVEEGKSPHVNGVQGDGDCNNDLIRFSALDLLPLGSEFVADKKIPPLTSPATGQWGLELGASENHFGE